MKKFRRLFLIIAFSTFLVIFNLARIYSAPITDPILLPVEKSELSIGLEEIVQIPNSGTDLQKAARLNLLLNAGDGSKRLFVNDMRGHCM